MCDKHEKLTDDEKRYAPEVAAIKELEFMLWCMHPNHVEPVMSTREGRMALQTALNFMHRYLAIREVIEKINNSFHDKYDDAKCLSMIRETYHRVEVTNWVSGNDLGDRSRYLTATEIYEVYKDED